MVLKNKHKPLPSIILYSSKPEKFTKRKGKLACNVWPLVFHQKYPTGLQTHALNVFQI